jgi:hypothetical protein
MRISYLLPWPNQLSAEKEFSFRLAAVLENLGHELVVVSERDFDRTAIEKRNQVFGDVLLLPHFTISPKEGIINIQLLWNSPKTVFEFRYGITYLAGADYFLSGGSAAVDRYFYESAGKKILGELHPSVPNVEFENQTKHGCKMFYSGINWERITGNRTRHSELLRKLDRANLVDIYGPSKLRGVEVWDGFRNYKGEIAMDGSKLIEIANTYGVTLALLNEQHLKWGLPSIRLAEAFRAKNVVISSDYSLLDFLGDSIFRIPNDLGIEKQQFYIGEKLNWIWNNPKEAAEMAKTSSALWFEKHSLEVQLKSFVSNITSQSLLQQYKINDYHIKYLDPYSHGYAQDLHLSLLSEDYDLIVHSVQTRDWAQKFFGDRESMGDESYFLTMANLIHDSMTMVHPGLESYSLEGPSFLVAETLIFDFKKLKEIALQIPLGSTSEVFTHVLLSEGSKGKYIPEIACKVNVTNRFALPIAINKPHQIIGLGAIDGLTYAPVNYKSRSQYLVKLTNHVSKLLPSTIKDVLRPIWLRIQR